MTAAKIVVTLLGIGAIAWVNYYFFAGRSAGTSVSPRAKRGDQSSTPSRSLP